MLAEQSPYSLWGAQARDDPLDCLVASLDARLRELQGSLKNMSATLKFERKDPDTPHVSGEAVVFVREDDFWCHEWQSSSGIPLELTRENDHGRAEVCELEHGLAIHLLYNEILRLNVQMTHMRAIMQVRDGRRTLKHQ